MAKKKKKKKLPGPVGRPPILEKRRRRTFWATDEEYRTMKIRARSFGTTLSEYIRDQFVIRP